MNTQIDRELPLPLYYQLKQIIIDSINEGLYKEDEMIPTEYELMEKYQLSRTTVRQAINDLVTEKYLYRKKGIGTFATSPRGVELINQGLYKVDSMIKKAGFKNSVKFLGVHEGKATAEVSAMLEVPLETPVYFMNRIRYADDTAISSSRSYIRKDMIHDFFEEAAEAALAFHKYLDKKGFPVEIIVETLEPCVLDSKTAKLLSLPPKKLAMIVKDIGYLKDHTPVEYSVSICDTTLLKYTLTAKREPTNPLSFKRRSE